MNISQNGINLIKSFEGCRLTAYKDIVGVLTIGYGQTGSFVHEGMTITQAQADQMLLEHLKAYVQDVNDALKVDVNQNQFDACCSLAFNVGGAAFAKSSIASNINAKNLDKAAQAFLLYDHAGGKVVQGLLDRRKKEEDLFNTPVPQAKPAPKTYTIISGDTFSKISVKTGVSVANLEKFNPRVNPNALKIGDVIYLYATPVPKPEPVAPKPIYHAVAAGENLTMIAKKNGLTLAQIESLNKEINYNILQLGEKVRVK